MILLDTNVVSALMQSPQHPSVVAWLDRQQDTDIYLPSITIAEIQYGLCRMPDGKRKAMLSRQFLVLTNTLFQGRVLVFGHAQADAYAILRAAREAQGRPISMADAQIAAIARVHHFALATRNTKDFEHCGLLLINPFLTNDIADTDP